MRIPIVQSSRHDIYNYDRALECRISLLQNDGNILESNKQSIMDFDLYLASEVGIARRIKYMWNLTEVAKMVGETQFIDSKERDIREIVRKIESNPNWEVWTRHGFKTAIKRFFRWLRQYPDDEDPPETKWIKIKRPKSRKLPEELLTEEEVKTLVNACEHNGRDKALIFVLYESGCRPGEILGLKRKHVRFDEFGAILIVNGKTGTRRVRIVAATPLLADWMHNAHPLKDDHAPLWINLEGKNYGEALQYYAARYIVKRRCEKAGLNKRVYMYLFRHTRATELANILTEAQLDEFCGWVQGSRMPSVYVHLSGKNTDPPILEAYGLKPKSKKEFENLKPKECPTCKTTNSPISEFCIRCGRPLNLQVALKIDDEQKKEKEKIDEMGQQIHKLRRELDQKQEVSTGLAREVMILRSLVVLDERLQRKNVHGTSQVLSEPNTRSYLERHKDIMRQLFNDGIKSTDFVPDIDFDKAWKDPFELRNVISLLAALGKTGVVRIYDQPHRTDPMIDDEAVFIEETSRAMLKETVAYTKRLIEERRMGRRLTMRK